MLCTALFCLRVGKESVVTRWIYSMAPIESVGSLVERESNKGAARNPFVRK